MKPGFERLAAAAIAILLARPVLAAGTDAACPAIDPPQAAGKPQAGLRVFRDPETGRLRPPTREEAAELDRMEAEAEAARESEQVFTVVEHPDGMKSVDLHGALMQSVAVTRNAGGSLTFRCLSSGPATDAAAPAAPPRPAHEEK